MTAKKRPWAARTLGPRLSVVMECLWRKGPQSAAEVHAALCEVEDLAYTTIHTELSRLLQKGLVKKRGRNLDTKYFAVMSRDEYLQATVKQTLADLIATHGASAVHGFVDLIADDADTMAESKKPLARSHQKP